jgi:hypothetical protein
MKKFVLFLFLAVAMAAPQADLFAKKAPVADTSYSINQEDPYRSNIESLLRYQEERRAKEKKAAMTRIGIGIAFLLVLVIGLSRRSKK